MKKIECTDLLGTGASMVGYLHDRSPEMPNRRERPAVIVCPGGGYEFLSEREMDPPAFAFFEHGYHVFILNYSVWHRGEPPLGMRPLAQLSAAVMEIRSRAGEWGVPPEQIAVCGFSAGGHLAASLGVHWRSPELLDIQETGGGRNHPNAVLLSYPVITTGEKAHRGSIDALCGGDPALEGFFSLEKQVTADAAPAFLWHAMDDDVVPVENTLAMAAALHSAGVLTELHCYEKGGHGLSVCRQETGRVSRRCESWLSLSMDWLDGLFGFEA